MDDAPETPKPAPETAPPAAAEPELPPFVIEGARSSRSKCKSCRKKIEKDILRLGILIEGPYGVGYLWHHLTCAAKRRFGDVEEAYERKAWKEAKEPPEDVPSIESLSELRDKAEEEKKSRKVIPWVEVDPSGRAKCKQCSKVMEKGSLRVVLGREVEFGTQYRTMPIHMHPKCVADGLDQPDCATQSDGLFDELRTNSRDVTKEQVDEVIAAIGTI